MSKEQQLNDLFARAKSAPAAVSFEETKVEFVKSLSVSGTLSISAKLKAFLNLKNGIIMFSIASVISIGVWLMVGNPTKNEPTKKTENQQYETVIDSKNVQPASNEIQTISKRKQVEFQEKYNLPIASIKIQELERKIAFDIQFPKTKPVRNYEAPSPRPYFPKLTEKEIADNHKQKKKMIKALAKYDSKVYSYIPAGSFDYNGQVVSVQSYFIQQAEVTNLEYRTFLFDLLIQERKDEFLAAQPDQTQWSTLTKEKNAYEDYYFSHPAYDNYPVVNISRKGAEMYCVWLTKETNSTLKDGEKVNDVRIPTRAEWVKAASNDGKQLPYSWDAQLTRNNEGIYLANYKMSAEEYAKIDTSLSVNMKANSNDLTAPSRSYFPNAYGLYNMCGNVAEMVNNTKINDKGFQMTWDGIGTAGGSWMNTAEEIKIYSPDPFKGVENAHPAIGFRVAFTHSPSN